MIKRLSPTAFGIALVGIALPALAQDLEPTPRRVLLSTGGVGLFEYVARVTDTQTLTLTTPLDQVDDLLRSLTVDDPTGTSVSARLAVRDPLPELFRGRPFPPEALEAPETLLAALKGEEVTLTGPKAMTGRLVSVTPETAVTAEGMTITRHRLGLMTDKGLRQAILEDVEAVALVDPHMRTEVDDALRALANHRREDSRTVAITLAGKGTRDVILAHVAEVPLWKATYRLTLPANAAGAGTASDASKSRLTGWAVLENLSGTDWKNVELGVISGSAVTFAQEIYSPYRVSRPLVPVEVPGRVLPPADGGAFPEASAEVALGMAPAPMAAPMATNDMMTQPRRASLQADAEEPTRKTMAMGGGFAQRAESLEAAVSDQVAAQVVFTLPTPVTLDSGQTLLVPLTDRAIPVTRVAHYIGTEGDGHPWAAARLTNTGDTALPPGAVSVTQDTAQGLAYLGDTRLTTLPPGEDRLLSFARDMDITVNQTRSDDRHLSGLTAAMGVLTLRQVARSETTYAIRNGGTEDREVVIDHPDRPGWTLTAPEGVTVTATAEAHRLTLTVPAGQTVTRVVAQERPLEERYVATDLSEGILASLSATGGLSAAEKRAIEQMVQLTARAAEYDRRAQALERDLDQVMADQGRLRDNLGSVPEDSDLHARFMTRMGQLEDRLTALRDQQTEALTEADAARTALTDYVSGLTLP
jgi:hypothetical protein